MFATRLFAAARLSASGRLANARHCGELSRDQIEAHGMQATSTDSISFALYPASRR